MPRRSARAFLLAYLAFASSARSPAQIIEPAPLAGGESVLPAPNPAAGLSLTDLEKIALQRNPTLAQAAAQVQASQSKALQAGLYPNPIVNYLGDLAGVQGSAGEFQGGILQQTIITAGKLRLSRAKFRQEAYEAELLVTAQQLRVLNGLQVAFYEILAVQQEIAIRRELAENAQKAVQATEEMVNVGQANAPDLLQAQVDARQTQVALGNAENHYRRNWERLVALAGAPELPPQPLIGRLEPDASPLDWECSLRRLLEESPVLQAARAEVVRDQIMVKRESVQWVPNITVGGGAGYDAEPGAKGAVSETLISIPIPVYDRNQGTVRQAQAELSRAIAEVSRLELLLRQELANTFTSYQNSLRIVRAYREEILPKSKQALELYEDYFRRQKRATWPQVLVAERAYFQQKEQYLEALIDFRRAEVAIHGLLLVDGLSTPFTVGGQGHIESVAKPR
jgi:cobalt-zinc-cadmium efflux system outer membrane protein